MKCNLHHIYLLIYFFIGISVFSACTLEEGIGPKDENEEEEEENKITELFFSLQDAGSVHQAKVYIGTDTIDVNSLIDDCQYAGSRYKYQLTQDDISNGTIDYRIEYKQFSSTGIHTKEKSGIIDLDNLSTGVCNLVVLTQQYGELTVILEKVSEDKWLHCDNLPAHYFCVPGQDTVFFYSKLAALENGFFEAPDFGWCVAYNANGTGVFNFKPEGIILPGTTPDLQTAFRWGVMHNRKGEPVLSDDGALYIYHEGLNGEEVDPQLALLPFYAQEQHFGGWDTQKVDNCDGYGKYTEPEEPTMFFAVYFTMTHNPLMYKDKYTKCGYAAGEKDYFYHSPIYIVEGRYRESVDKFYEQIRSEFEDNVNLAGGIYINFACEPMIPITTSSYSEESVEQLKESIQYREYLERYHKMINTPPIVPGSDGNYYKEEQYERLEIQIREKGFESVFYLE